MPDGGEEGARSADGHRHQERVGRDSHAFGERDGHRRRQHSGRRVVDDVGEEHHGHHQNGHGHRGGDVLPEPEQAVGDQLRSACVLHGLADRHHRGQQDDDGPVDAGVDVAQGDEAGQHHDHRDDHQADGHRDDIQGYGHQRDSKKAARQQDPAGLADAQVARRQWQTAQCLQTRLQFFLVSLHQEYIPGDEARPAQSLLQPVAAAGDREHVHSVSLSQQHAAGCGAYQQRARRHHRLGHREPAFALLTVLGFLLVAPRHLQTGEVEQGAQVVRLGFDHEHVVLLQDRIQRGHLPAPALALQGDHHDIGFALDRSGEVVDRLAGVLGSLGHPDLSHVVLDLEGIPGRSPSDPA